ncbi:hypothetical protein B0T25DRAFT_561589 [Lasiosphaeria hispida]|uniref:Uncharacterized protein n=1 Tax=Lasiosphaeria hispida TaxID=260671 RepID=A0AAJ0MJC1_9PEZI|nr:hypothetical protein B0T25DRAFT_561589 [Lasiosphaeria hispida]
MHAESLWRGSPQAKQDHDTEYDLGKNVQHAVENGLRVWVDDVAALGQAPGNGGNKHQMKESRVPPSGRPPVRAANAAGLSPAVHHELEDDGKQCGSAKGEKSPLLPRTTEKRLESGIRAMRNKLSNSSGAVVNQSINGHHADRNALQILVHGITYNSTTWGRYSLDNNDRAVVRHDVEWEDVVMDGEFGDQGTLFHPAAGYTGNVLAVTGAEAVIFCLPP